MDYVLQAKQQRNRRLSRLVRLQHLHSDIHQDKELHQDQHQDSDQQDQRKDKVLGLDKDQIQEGMGTTLRTANSRDGNLNNLQRKKSSGSTKEVARTHSITNSRTSGILNSRRSLLSTRSREMRNAKRANDSKESR